MHTLKQIIRLMNKNRRTTLLLVFSLFVGLTTYILISARVNYHLSFDKQGSRLSEYLPEVLPSSWGIHLGHLLKNCLIRKSYSISHF